MADLRMVDYRRHETAVRLAKELRRVAHTLRRENADHFLYSEVLGLLDDFARLDDEYEDLLMGRTA